MEVSDSRKSGRGEMVLVNIVDHRKRKYRFKKVNAVVEAAWHDNSCKDADRIPRNAGRGGPDYEEKEHLSLTEAVRWAGRFRNPVTLFLYDKNDGIYVVWKKPRRHRDKEGKRG